MSAFTLQCLTVPAFISKLVALLLLVLEVVTADATSRCEIECTQCECKAFSTADEFVCRCYDFIENTTQYYRISELPPNNLTAPVRIFMGETSSLMGASYKEKCSNQPAFKIIDPSPRPTNTTRPELILFNNFDFSDDRAYHFSPWLENIRDYLKNIHILCGTMRTLRRGMFQGFGNLTSLLISQTGLENIEAGAFVEFAAGHPTKLAEFFVHRNPLRSFDWSVLEPVAFNLKHIWLSHNEINEMSVSSPVSFPALRDINLESNRLRSIRADVVATWPEESLFIELVYNSLCYGDSLCRCCSLVPLFEFAKRTRSFLHVFCGHTEKEDYCETTFVRRTPKCTSPCVKDGNLTDLAQISDYDLCNDFDVETMSCEPP